MEHAQKQNPFKTFLLISMSMLVALSTMFTSMAGIFGVNVAEAAPTVHPPMYEFFPNHSPVQSAPDTILIEPGLKIPADYTFFPEKTAKTVVKPFGKFKSYKTDTKAFPTTKYPNNRVHEFKYEQNAVGAFGADYTNVGVFEGKSIDMRMTVMGWDGWLDDDNKYRPTFYVNDEQLGINSGGANVLLRYEFFENGTGKAIMVKGMFTIADIDAFQGVEIFNTTNYKNLYVTKDSPLLHSQTPKGVAVFIDKDNHDLYGPEGEVDGDDPNHQATFTFNQNFVEFKFYQENFRSTYKPRIPEGYEEQYPNGYTDINMGASYLEFYRKPIQNEIKPPIKDVSDTNEFNVLENELSKIDEVFTYEINTTVPAEIDQNKYTQYVFEDVLEDVLSVKGVKVLDRLGKDVSDNFVIKIDGNKVTATPENVRLDTFYNQDYKYVIEAQVIKGADLSPYLDEYGKYNIPNKASISIDGDSYPTNKVVTVIDKDLITTYLLKSVNGKMKEDLQTANEVFTYEITSEIPANADKFTITDKLVDELLIVGTPEVSLPGVTAMVSGQTVTLDLSAEHIAKYANSEVTLTIQAQIKDDADLSKYDNKVPNNAHLVANGTEYESPVVIVSPPKVVKTINGVEHVELNSVEELFTYEVTTKVPGSGKSFVISDELVKELEVARSPKVSLDGMEAKVDGNVVTVEFDENQIAHYANQDVTLTIEAKVRDNADLSTFKNKVPNKAEIKINNKPTESNIVTVSPPVANKTVNGKEHVDLKQFDEKFTYDITTIVPNEGKSFVITDEIVNELEIVGNPSFSVKGIDAKVEGNKVTLTMNEVQIKENKGKEVTLTIEAKIKDGADLSTYYDNKIPNRATIQIDNKPVITTNPVTVTPPKPAKTVNGKEHEGLDSWDEVFTYEIKTTVPHSAEKFVIADKLVKELNIVETDFSLKGIKAMVDGQNISVTMNQAQVKEHEGKDVVLTIKAQIKKGANLSVYEDNTVPNVATFQIDNNPVITTNPVTVKPPHVVKTVNDKFHEELTNLDEVFTYEIETFISGEHKSFKITDKLVNELEIVSTDVSLFGVEAKVDGQTVTVELNELQVEKFADQKVILLIKAKIKDGADISGYKNNAVPNKATVEFGNGPAIETNEVTVTPPTVKKTVNGKGHEDLKELDEVFTYEIKTIVPANAESLLITDKLVNELNIVETSVNLKGVDAKVDGQTVTVKMNEKQVESNKNKEIVLTIKAQIKDGADLSTYKDSKVPNKATIVIDKNPEITTNTVTVATPKPVKTVNGKEHENLNDLEEHFTYEIRTTVPESAESFLISDELIEELEIVGEPTFSLKGINTKVDGQLVTVKMNEGQIEQFAGKEAVLTIVSKIKFGADLSTYKDNKLPNVGSFQIDDKPAIETNEVTVTPPTAKKTVNGVVHVDLTNAKEVFKYEIETVIPSNAKSFEIVDELKNELEIVGTPSTNLKGIDAKVDGQTVSVKLNQSQIKANEGKTIILLIEAKVKDGADLSGYTNNTIPNQATIQIDNEPEITTNPVTVTPPKEETEKTVNGKHHENLLNKDEEFVYEIKSILPAKAESFVMTDVLVKELEIVGSPTVSIDGATAKVDGQKVTVTLNEEQIAKNAGKEIVLTIKAIIKDEADISVYKNNKVPNDATIQIDNNPEIKTNEVTVTIPEITKSVNSVTHVNLKEINEVVTYKVNTTVPADAKSLVLTDELVKDLQIVGTPKTSIKGVEAVVNGQVVTVTMNEKQTKEHAGKELVLTIEAKIKDGADLTLYENNAVPNDATVQIDNNPSIKSNTVTIISQVTPPNFHKTVNGVEAVELESNKEEFVYEINVHVPEAGKTFIIADELVKELEIIGQPTTNLKGMETKVKGQKVVVNFNEKQITEHAGKKLTLTIHAKVKEGADLSVYKDEKVPNTALYQLDNKPVVESNEVTVVVPKSPETPVTPEVKEDEIIKTVNGVNDAKLDKVEEEFKYEIKVNVPKEGKSFIVADELVKELEIVGTPSTSLDGIEAKVDGQKVLVSLNEEEIKKHAGKELILTIEAKIKEDADLSVYKDGKVPNTALYQIDNNPVKQSNEVTVHIHEDDCEVCEKPVEKPACETCETPVKPGNEQTTTNGDKKPNNTGGFLPQTGSSVNYGLLFAGALLLAMGGFVIYRRNRNKVIETENE